MTITKFTPAKNTNFQFQATFDNVVYTIVCTWNIYGQRYYVNCFDSNANRIFTVPIIASPDGYDINIIGGYFNTSKMIFRASTKSFEVTP